MPVLVSLPHIAIALRLEDTDLLKHVGICITQIYIKGNRKATLSESRLERDAVGLRENVRFLKQKLIFGQSL